MSVTKLWILLQKCPNTNINHINQNDLHFIRMKMNSKNDLINNYYSILILNNIQRQKLVWSR